MGSTILIGYSEFAAQMKLIQLATEHPDWQETFILKHMSYGIDLALSELEGLEALLKPERE